MKHEILYEDDITKTRVGKLKVNKKSVKTPIIWMGNLILNQPKPAELPQINTIMLNVHEILSNKNILKSKKESIENIHSLVNYKGLIMMDSGGFLFQKKDEININPAEILDLYYSLKPEFGVVMDHPMDPSKSFKVNHNRWLKTIENTKLMLTNHSENNSEISLVPVIHGYTTNEIKKACKAIHKITNPEVVGIGSLVPLMMDKQSKSIRGSNGKGARYFAIEAINIVREEFPDSLIHVFGVGGTTTMHLMFSLGVDSVDSMGWRLKAAFGAIQLPGVGDRFITPKNNGKGRSGLSEEEESLLEECVCPICKGKDLKERKKELDNADPKNFQNRAIHNSHVFKEEAELFIRNVEKGRMIDFIEERLARSPYKPLFEYSLDM